MMGAAPPPRSRKATPKQHKELKLSIAVESFVAASPSELSLNAGETIVCVLQPSDDDPGWTAVVPWPNRTDDPPKLVPTDFVEPLPKAVSIEDFRGLGEGEVSLSEGEHVFLLPAEVQRGWSYVLKLDGLRGYVRADMLLEPRAAEAASGVRPPQGKPEAKRKPSPYSMKDPAAVSTRHLVDARLPQLVEMENGAKQETAKAAAVEGAGAIARPLPVDEPRVPPAPPVSAVQDSALPSHTRMPPPLPLAFQPAGRVVARAPDLSSASAGVAANPRQLQPLPCYPQPTLQQLRQPLPQPFALGACGNAPRDPRYGACPQPSSLEQTAGFGGVPPIYRRAPAVPAALRNCSAQPGGTNTRSIRPSPGVSGSNLSGGYSGSGRINAPPSACGAYCDRSQGPAVLTDTQYANLTNSRVLGSSTRERRY